METTIDLPDSMLRDAEATPAAEGKSLKQFVAEAVSDRLRRTTPSTPFGPGNSPSAG